MLDCTVIMVYEQVFIRFSMTLPLSFFSKVLNKLTYPQLIKLFISSHKEFDPFPFTSMSEVHIYASFCNFVYCKSFYSLLSFPIIFFYFYSLFIQFLVFFEIAEGSYTKKRFLCIKGHKKRLIIQTALFSLKN